MEKEVVEKFEQQVQWLHEVEYGDFKRKLSLYILRLQQGLQSNRPKVVELIESMRDTVIYNPVGDIEITRAKVLDTVEKLKPLV